MTTDSDLEGPWGPRRRARPAPKPPAPKWTPLQTLTFAFFGSLVLWLALFAAATRL